MVHTRILIVQFMFRAYMICFGILRGGGKTFTTGKRLFRVCHDTEGEKTSHKFPLVELLKTFYGHDPRKSCLSHPSRWNEKMVMNVRSDGTQHKKTSTVSCVQ